MLVRDALWTPRVNLIVIECDCGAGFVWWSNISLAECPWCHRKEWWFEMNPAPPIPGYATARLALRQ